MSATANSDIPGARESNAGDDFHFLWAVRSTLQMLVPNSKLSGINIEGVSEDDRSAIAQDDLLLGADLTEYYGSNRFEDATRVVISQLKYSTRHPGRAWTTARLAANAAKDKAVVRRLTGLVQAYLENHDADEVKMKLVIRLVSNQPVSGELLQALADAKAVLNASPITQTDRLLKSLPDRSRSEIQSLYKASGASSSAFVAFLSVFDLSYCGGTSRALLGIEILQQLGLSTVSPGNDLRKLYELIRDLAVPNTEGFVVTRTMVLAALGLSGDAQLFPAPPKFQYPEIAVPTSDARRVADFIAANKGKQVLVHGPAGIGKTTTILQVPDYLPSGTEVFSFDCFGGGDYLHMGKERHRSEECFVQVSNELAVRLGTALIVYRPTDPINAGKVFASRIEKASRLIGTDALLVIVLDATDNAVTASRARNSPSFVSDLRSFDVPANCCIVYTCRTHRRHLIEGGESLPQIELEGFDLRATTAFIRTHLPNASNTLCAEIHERSAGIPRFQAYLLNHLLSQDKVVGDEAPPLTVTSLAAVTELALNDLFEGILKTAEGIIPALVEEKHDGISLLPDLVALARPLTIDDFSEFTGISVEQAEQFCGALVPGIRITHRAIEFPDEDFDTYLRSKVEEEERSKSIERLSERLFAKCKHHIYAAEHVADFLVLAKRWDDAIRLALEGPNLQVIPDEVTRLHTLLRRYAAALTACNELRNYPSAAKILVHAAEAKRTSETVFKLVRQFPDLVAVYGDIERLGEEYLRQHEESVRADAPNAWLGAAHLRVAAMYARQPFLRANAKGQLESAYAWFRLRETLPAHEKSSWDINDEDIASETEAIYHLAGPEAAIESILRWTPREAVQRAARIVVRHLRGNLDNDGTEALLRAAERVLPLNLRTYGVAYLASCLYAEGISIPVMMLERIAFRIENLIRRGVLPPLTERAFREDAWSGSGWTTTIVEALIRSGFDNSRTEAMLSAFSPKRPSYAPNAGALTEWDGALRSAFLLAKLQAKKLALENIRPSGWSDPKNVSDLRSNSSPDDTSNGRVVDEEQERRFQEFMGRLVPMYEIWAETVVNPQAASEIKSRILSNMQGGSDWSPYNADPLTFPIRCQVACEAVRNCYGLKTSSASAESDILLELKNSVGAKKQIDKVTCWLLIASSVARIESLLNTALEILEHVAAYVEVEPIPANERWQALMNCARIALPYSPELCQEFYRCGLKASEDVDDESVPAITALCALSRSLATTGTEEKRRWLSTSLRMIAEGYRLRLTEESRFPWDELLQAISSLDAREALATSYQWDNTGIRDIDVSLPTVLTEAVRQNVLNPTVAMGLLSFSRSHWYDMVERYGPDDRFGASATYREVFLALKKEGVTTKQQLEALLNEFTERLLRDFSLGQRVRIAQEFVSWADTNAVTGSSVEKLRKVTAFVEALPREKLDSRYDTNSKWEEERETEKANRHNAYAKLLADAGNSGLISFKERFEEAHLYDYQNGPRSFCFAVAGGLQHGQRPELLRELLSLVPEYRGHIALQLAKELIERWKTNPLIQPAVESAITDLLRNHLRDVFYRFNDLVTLSRQPPIELVNIYLDGVASKLSTWGSGPLFLALQHVGSRLSNPDCWQIADEAALYLLGKIKVTAPDLRPVASGMNEAVAGFLFAMCGHAKVSVRWDALHSARFIARSMPEAFLRVFMPLTLNTDAPVGFALNDVKGGDFRWMTARVFALMLLERIADEIPSAIRPHAPLIEHHLFTPDFPHAQARELARRTILHLLSNFPENFSPQQVHEIKAANRPIGCLYPRASGYENRSSWLKRSRATSSGQHFDFDSIDIIPYWFDPASSIFRIDLTDFIDAAENWAAKHWGRQNVYPSWNDGVRHGSLPTVETEDVYVSYHAMHCVMGELVIECPVSVSPYDYDDASVPCPWDEWMSKFLPGDGYWLADLRQATPLQADLWQEPADVEAWMDDASDEEFDRTVLVSPQADPDWTLVYGSVTYMSSQLYSSTSVLSAMVLPDAALSLLRALTAAGTRYWQLPVNGWPMSDGWRVAESGFALDPLLAEREHREEIGHLDPRAVDVPSGGRIQLADDFVASTGIQLTKNGLGYSDSQGHVVSRFEHWSDNPKSDRIHAFFTSGSRLWIRTDILLRYLQFSNRELIVSATHRRNYSYEYRKNRNIDGDRNEERNRLHLLRNDGTLETVAGRRPYRSANS